MNKIVIHAASTQCKSRKGSKSFSRARKRLREIQRIINGRHGDHVPATDDADRYLVPVANCFRKIAADLGHPKRMESLFQFWCSDHAPDIADEEVSRIAHEAMAGPAKLIPDEVVGEMIRLSYAERLERKATTIGSFDVDRAMRTRFAKERRKKRDRVRREEARRASGALPRAIYEANSLSQTEPWKAEGISRRTWERRRKKVDASASPHLLLRDRRRTCVKTPDSAERLRATAPGPSCSDSRQFRRRPAASL